MSGGPSEKRQLGKILLKQRLITEEELSDLLEQQKVNPGQRLASVAMRAGKITEVDLLKALSEQHGLPGIDLTQVVVPLDNLKLIPGEIARQHLILPILVKDDRIFLAMADPGDRRVIDEIEFVTGRKVFPYVALQESLKAVIEDAYRLRERGEAYYIGPNAPEDYLSSLGLTRGGGNVGSEPPEPAPGRQTGVVVDREMPSEDDLGLSELVARLDRGGESPGPPSKVGPLPKRAGVPKVLIVDDEDDIRRLLRRVLADKGYEVIEASKGLEALQAVKAHVPDVILLDAMLPEVHGFDICRRIKGSKRYGHIPIVMCSAIYRGWRVAEDLKQSYGVEAFLEKPFKINDVLGAVGRALDKKASGPQPPPPDPLTSEELSRDASEALQRGIEAFKRGALDEAIARLKEGLGIDPLSFRLHYHLGLLYGRKDQIFEAIHELETAIDLQPRNFSALRNLAVLYQRAGFKHKAVEMWERALGNAPDEETRRGIKDHLVSLL